MLSGSPFVRRVLALSLLGAVLLGPRAALAEDALAGLPPLPSGALRAYLVRHGQALSNLDPAPALPPEQLDHLTPLGRQQAEAVGRALAEAGVVAVLASPASRARETAEAVAAALGLPAPAVERRLRATDLGLGPDGRPLAWKDRTAEWEAGRDPTPPGGESLEDVSRRATELVRALARSRRGAAVVLVTHSDVLAAYIGGLRGTPPPRRYPADLATGSITVVDIRATGAATILLAGHVPAPTAAALRREAPTPSR